MKTKLHFLAPFVACAAICIIPLQMAFSQTISTATGSGDWDNPNLWDPAGVPDANTTDVFIPNGYTVDKSAAGTSRARVKVGSNASGGTLNISGGIISSASTSIGLHEVATAANSTGTINVTGGTLRTTSNNGGGIRAGVGDNSSGFVNISSGTITATSGIHLGFGSNATGTMTVSGGTVNIATGTAAGILGLNPISNPSNNPNFFVGGLISSAFNRNGVFEQTGGTVNVTDSVTIIVPASHEDNSTSGDVEVTAYWYMGVGNAQAETNNPVGTATITGGSLTANVKVGRNSDLTTAGGSGSLTIGHGATVQGQSQAWEVSANGTLEFRLGANDSFNAVDLTTVTTAEAIMFTQAGATLQIDGSSLLFSSDYDPITLVSYASGKGPSLASLANVNYSFIGFEPGLTADLQWTDTALVLTVVPEPAAATFLLGLIAMGWIVFARRRCATARN
jgi:hypothetical protein